jgi:hypothetical protein
MSGVCCEWELSPCRRAASCSMGHEGNRFALCDRHVSLWVRQQRRECDAVRAFLAAVGVSDLAAFGADPLGAVAAVGAFDGEYRRCRFSRVFGSRRWAGVFDGCSDADDIVDTCRIVLERAGDL